MKLAFFDIDGVLSIPCYEIEGKMKPGGSEAWWKAFCDVEIDPYKDCKIPRRVYEKLGELTHQGYTLFVLSTENIATAQQGKIKFILDKYGDYFDYDHILFVDSDSDKVKRMCKLATRENVKIRNVYYVDDTFGLVLEASVVGIDAHHISEFLEIKE